jgi:serine/threonine-protein kinase
MTQEQATQALNDKGLTVGTISSDYSDTVPEGQVISQSEDADKMVYAGTSVSFVVSLGVKEVTYKFSTRILAPETTDVQVVSASIQLLDANGNVLEHWDNVDISQFGSEGYVISVSGIKDSSSGEVIIEWLLDDGSTSTNEKEVTFTQE